MIQSERGNSSNPLTTRWRPSQESGCANHLQNRALGVSERITPTRGRPGQLPVFSHTKTCHATIAAADRMPRKKEVSAATAKESLPRGVVEFSASICPTFYCASRKYLRPLPEFRASVPSSRSCFTTSAGTIGTES